jgi:isoamylase
MLSHGVPMLLSGDEIGQSQQGNNNCYCQDNERTWLHWDLSDSQNQLLAFARSIIPLGREQPVLQRRRFFYEEALGSKDAPSVAWISADGKEMSQAA